MGDPDSGQSAPQRLDLPTLAGDVLMLLSAFVLGIKIVFTKYAVSRVEPNKLIFWHHMFGAALFVFCSVPVENVSRYRWRHLDAAGNPGAALPRLGGGTSESGPQFRFATYDGSGPNVMVLYARTTRGASRTPTPCVCFSNIVVKSRFAVVLVGPPRHRLVHPLSTWAIGTVRSARDTSLCLFL